VRRVAGGDRSRVGDGHVRVDGSHVCSFERTFSTPPRIPADKRGMKPPRGTITITEAAKKLGVCSDTMRTYCRRGLVSFIRTPGAWFPIDASCEWSLVSLRLEQGDAEPDLEPEPTIIHPRLAKMLGIIPGRLSSR
jgi:hypothetical protein